MKKIINILIILFSLFSFSYSFAETENNIEIGTNSSNISNSIENTYLDKLGGEKDIKVGDNGASSIKELLVVAAKDLKIIFLLVAGVYFLILVIKILFSENTEEESANFKKGILWITAGIIVMQISYYFVNTLYGQDVNSGLANDLTDNIIEPIIKIVEAATSFFFMIVAIIAFYKLVSTNGNEEDSKSAKMSILYAIIGFITVKLARVIILTTYGQIDCKYNSVANIFGGSCAAESNLSDAAQLIVDVINWLNGFVGIAVILMIIYAGIQVLFSGGDEEKITSAKKSLIYIFVGLLVLAMNYFILSFFILA